MQPNYQLLIYKRIGQRIAVFGLILVSAFGTFGSLALVAKFPLLTIVVAGLGLAFGLAVTSFGISIFNNATVSLSGGELVIRGIRKRVSIPYDQIFDIDIGSIEKLFPNGKLPAADVAWLGDFYNLNGLLIQLRPSAHEHINLEDLHHLIYNEKRNECLLLVKDWIELSKLVKEYLSMSEDLPQKSASDRFREMVDQAGEYPFESVVTAQSKVFVLGRNRKISLQVKTMLTSTAHVEVIHNFEKGLERIQAESPDLFFLVDSSFSEESMAQLMQIRQAQPQIPMLYVSPELGDEEVEKIHMLTQVETLPLPLDRDLLIGKTNDWVNWRKRQAANSKGMAGIVEVVQGREPTLPVDVSKIDEVKDNVLKEIMAERDAVSAKTGTKAMVEKDEFESIMADVDSDPRPVTFMVISLKSISKLKDHFSTKDYDRFVESYFAETEKIVSSQFGTVEEKSEQTVIFSFGVDRELDPARQGLFSLNTAFGIQALLDQMGEPLAPEVLDFMQPSIGVFAAKARIKTDLNSQKKVVLGAPKHLANVLARRAQAGQILCGRNTLKPVYKRFEFKSIGNLVLDKEDIEIPVFEITKRVKPVDRERVLA